MTVAAEMCKQTNKIVTILLTDGFASQLACEVYFVVVHTHHLPALQKINPKRNHNNVTKG